MKKLIVLISVGLISLASFAQPANAVTEVRNGKIFYVHVVEKGNTLYGIHKLYSVPVEDILNANDGMTETLELGQKVYVPTGKDGSGGITGQHTVMSGETLYGISKKYKCTVNEIKALNPGVEGGLSIGQILKIPGKSFDS